MHFYKVMKIHVKKLWSYSDTFQQVYNFSGFIKIFRGKSKTFFVYRDGLRFMDKINSNIRIFLSFFVSNIIIVFLKKQTSSLTRPSGMIEYFCHFFKHRNTLILHKQYQCKFWTNIIEISIFWNYYDPILSHINVWGFFSKIPKCPVYDDL